MQMFYILMPALFSFFLSCAVADSNLSMEKNDESPAALAALSVNQLSYDLLESEYKQGDNLLLAPYSISSALAMTLAGAAGETHEEMLTALRYSQGEQLAHVGFANLKPLLTASKEREGYQLDVANRLFGQTGMAFHADFLHTTQTYYGAPLQPLDFHAAPDAARQTINTWVEDQTSERIKNLLGPGAITPATRLTLVNAVYFNGDWKYKFDENFTSNDEFLLDNGEAVPAMFMNTKASLRTLRSEEHQLSLAELPYAVKDQAASSVSMIIALPDSGISSSDAIAALRSNGDALMQTLTTAVPKQVNLKLPKWKVAGETINLKPTLMAKGMASAFSPGAADFSRIADVGSDKLFIEGVFHKTFISVTEGGTEAAGATAVTVGITSISRPENFFVTRSFIYLIRDNVSGAILFIGNLAHPQL